MASDNKNTMDENFLLVNMVYAMARYIHKHTDESIHQSIADTIGVFKMYGKDIIAENDWVDDPSLRYTLDDLLDGFEPSAKDFD